MAKLTSAIALEIVERLEALKAKYNDDVAAVYREVSTYDGHNNGNVISDIMKARAAVRDAEYDAQALIESFDSEGD